MKRYFLFGLIIFSFFILGGCVYNRFTVNLPPSPREAWISSIECDPNVWMRGADTWFVIGNPNFKAKPKGFYTSPYRSIALSFSPFNKIIANTDAQIHIVTTLGEEGVCIEGPLQAIKAIVVRVDKGSLIISQIKKSPSDVAHVTIVIKVKCLNYLEQWGRGRIEGIHLNTDYLDVMSAGSGNLFLRGNMNLQHLRNWGKGCITIFGAQTPSLNIETKGSGVNNIEGNVGIKNIIHAGSNNINIIGANSNFLKIYAYGSGKIGISGIVNLNEVRALGQTRVFIDKVASSNLYVLSMQNANVGLAGFANTVNFKATDASRINARYLHADSAFISSSHKAHINISAKEKIFATASDNSSIYYFGDKAKLTAFSGGNGTVIAMQ